MLPVLPQMPAPQQHVYDYKHTAPSTNKGSKTCACSLGEEAVNESRQVLQSLFVLTVVYVIPGVYAAADFY